LIVRTTGGPGLAQIDLGNQGGTGRLNIDSFVSIQSAGSNIAALRVGRDTGSTGTLNMNGGTLEVRGIGTGSSIIDFGDDNGSATATITNSSIEVVNDNNGGATSSVNVGRDGATGNVTMTDSTLVVEDFLSIGRNGTGTLTLQGNSVVDNNDKTGLTRVGRDGGTGTLNIVDNAALQANNLHLGRDINSVGTVNVSGSGLISVTDTIRVGSDSSSVGTLNVGDNPATGSVETGGSVTGHTLQAGLNQIATGTVNVIGTGATINLSGLAPNTTGGPPGALDGANLAIGVRGLATMNVTDGGQVTVAPGSPVNGGLSGGMVVGGSRSNPTGTGKGTVNVDGAGSSITFSAANGQAGFTQVGRDGTGVLNITNGGLVNDSAQTAAVVGRLAGSSGTVNVTGTGSTWNAGSFLGIGTDVDLLNGIASGPGGTGVVNIANGGHLLANNIVNGAGGTITGGGGTITGDIENHGIIAAGNSPGIMTVNGNLTLATDGITQIELGGVVFDSGASTYEYDRIEVSGNVTVDDGATFDVSYFGGFSASAGDFFDVLVAGAFVFSDMNSWNVSLPSLAGGLLWDFSIFAFSETQSSLRLTVVADSGPVPAPPMQLLMIAALAGMALMRRRQTA
jgi:T5SS/PEP-CTERM-associated repeat protein